MKDGAVANLVAREHSFIVEDLALEDETLTGRGDAEARLASDEASYTTSRERVYQWV